MKKLLLTLTLCLGVSLLLQAETPTAQEANHHQELIQTIGDSTVSFRSKSKVEDFKEKRFVLIYFSAHWCAPCRNFTPQLVKFYNRNIKKGDLELVFVSADRSQEDMDKYMKEAKMPWLGIKLKSPAASKLSSKYGSTGIPHLVLLDENDKVIARGQANVFEAYASARKKK